MAEPTPSPPSLPSPDSGPSIGVKAIAGVVAFVLLFFLARAVITRAPQAGGAGTVQQQDPYTLMTREFFDHSYQFQVALARGVEAGVRRSLPDARVTVEDRAVVTNLGQALRAIVVYRSETATAGGRTLSLDAQLRQYIHRAGLVVVEAACFSDGSSCELPRELIDRTDTAVLQHLTDEGVEALLPRDADCESASMPIGDAVHRVTVCRPGPDVRLSVMRFSRDEALAEFRRLAADPGSQAIGGQVARDAP